MHMITPGVAASLTPRQLKERPPRSGGGLRLPRLHVPQLHVPRWHLPSHHV